MKPAKAALRAIRSHLPEQKLTNEDLAREFGDWDVEKIYSKTGISVRAIAGPEECASDLGVKAAEKIFAETDLNPDGVDFLIFCTQSPDYFLPASACTMQSRLKLKTSCGAVDINQGCSGFVYGLSLAKGLIESGIATNVLLITAETYSKYIDPEDRSVRTIFGDGAAAAWIGGVASDVDLIGPFVLGTDGGGANKLIVEAGAARVPGPAAGHSAKLYMNGPEVFTFTLSKVPGAVDQLLLKSGKQLADIDYFVFHQANRFMLEQLRRKLRIPEDNFCINLQHYGNTVSATIPMALEIALKEGKVHTGNLTMLVGFGVGFSWAACLLRIVD